MSPAARRTGVTSSLATSVLICPAWLENPVSPAPPVLLGPCGSATVELLRVFPQRFEVVAGRHSR